MNRYVWGVRVVPVVIIVLCLSGGCTKKTDETSALVGTIIALDGEVAVNGAPAAVNGKIEYGDTIITGLKSWCRIVIDERNIIKVGPDSLMVYRLRKDDGRLELRRGYMAAVLKNLKNVNEFRVTTPTVAAGIRGTALCVAAESPDKTYACVCNGRIGFLPEGAKEEKLVAAAHHQAAHYVREKGKIVVKDAGMLFHTDKDIEAMAAEIGVAVDWSRIE